MNTLSKTQVIALFLGAASAQTVLDNLNGLTSADTVPADQTLWTANAGGDCNALGGCDAENNKCANLQLVGADNVTTCVYEDFCGSYGRVGGAAFTVNCWTAVAEGETPTQPTDIADPAQMMTDLEGLITKTVVSWDGHQDMIVSSRYNYQDGWFIKLTADNYDDLKGILGEDDAGELTVQTDVGKWKEFDKAADQRCFLDLQCPSDSCCGAYPDSNNKRCMSKDLDKVSQTVGPVTFSPTCPNNSAEDAVPENAQDDISAGALAEANEELDKWRNSLESDAKDAAGYDTDACDTACKEKFDKDFAAAAAKTAEFIDELKAEAKYDTADCDDACKAVFEASLLKWEKEAYQTCVDDKTSIACREANEIYKDTVKARGNAYYAGEASDRETFDGARSEAVEALESTLAAAWLASNDPGAGNEGGECAADGDSCTNPEEMDAEGNEIELCCGTMTHSTQKDDKGAAVVLVNKCANKKTKSYTDSLSGTYTHVCGAFKIGASLGAAVVAALYM